MSRYLRITPSIKAPSHRFVGYVHGLNSTVPSTLEEYLNVWKRQEEEFGHAQWTKIKVAEAEEALEWLVAHGFAKVVE